MGKKTFNKTSTVENGEDIEMKTFRRLLPQVIVAIIFGFLVLNEGISITVPAVIIPDLIKNNETIHLTPSETSWLGSVGSIAQPFGCLFAVIACELVGRRFSMFLVTLPSIIGWIVLHFASTSPALFVANIIFGFSVSSTTITITTYTMEIFEPSVRGTLFAAVCISAGLGISLMFFLNSFIEWRILSLYCMIVPIACLIPLFMIPDSPYFLLSKDRQFHALQSLKWFRGWKISNSVEQEFEAMRKHRESANTCISCNIVKEKCLHPRPSSREKLISLKQSSTMKPLFILVALTFFSEFNGGGLRVYIVQVFKTMGSPWDPNRCSSIAGAIATIGLIFTMATIRRLGKRKLFFIGLLGTSICHLVIAIYMFIYAPSGLTSFDVISNIVEPIETNYIGMSFAFIRSFFSPIIVLIPKTLYGECFPLNIRSLAIGLITSIGYLLQFASVKLHYNFELWLNFTGTSLLYALFGFTGLIFTSLFMIETENRTLEEIERHFSSKDHKWTNCHIKKSSKSMSDQ